MQTQITKEQMVAGLELMAAVYDVIRTAGPTGQPNGELYARLMDKLPIEAYNKLLATLKNAGLVRETNHVLYANDPAKR